MNVEKIIKKYKNEYKKCWRASTEEWLTSASKTANVVYLTTSFEVKSINLPLSEAYFFDENYKCIKSSIISSQVNSEKTPKDLLDKFMQYCSESEKEKLLSYFDYYVDNWDFAHYDNDKHILNWAKLNCKSAYKKTIDYYSNFCMPNIDQTLEEIKKQLINMLSITHDKAYERAKKELEEMKEIVAKLSHFYYSDDINKLSKNAKEITKRRLVCLIEYTNLLHEQIKTWESIER